MSLVKGIKKGKTIELLEEINIPDGQEILIDIQTVNNFWNSLEEFRNSQDFKNVDFEDDIFANLRVRDIYLMTQFPRYESYKDSGIDWLGEIPSHWKIFVTKRLSNRIQAGSTPPTSATKYYEDGNISWFSPASFTSDLVLKNPVKFLSLSAIEDGVARIFESGTTMVVGIGVTIGKVGYINHSASCNQQITGITFYLNCVVPKFGAYHIKALEVVMRGIAPSATLPILDQQKIGYLPFCLPPISEQQKIVEFLERKIAEIDEAIAKKQKLIELLQEQKAILINRSVTKGLNPNVKMRDRGIEWIGEIPEHWETRRLKYIFAETDKRSENGTEILLSLRMIEGLISHNDVSDKPIQSKDLIGYKKIKSGQLVMNRMRATLGLFAIAEIDGLVSPDYAIFDIVTECFPTFFLYLFRTSIMKDTFFINSKGLGDGTAGFLRLYSDRFGILKVPFPPLEEQKLRVNHIQNIEKNFTITLRTVRNQIQKLQELKQVRISNAVTGKIKI